MNTLALWIIALCMVAQNVSVYRADTGGWNVFFGSFGYHLEGKAK